MDHATQPYPDPVSLAEVARCGVDLFQAEPADLRIMEANDSLALLVVGPAHAEAFIHPAATDEQRVCLLEVVHDAVHDPAAYAASWYPAEDDGWELWLGLTENA